MHKLTTASALGLMLGVALVAAPSLHAQDPQTPSDQKSDQGMMRGGMMGQGGMDGMMNMMQQMMEQCNKMMSGGMRERDRRDDQPGREAPAKPEQKG